MRNVVDLELRGLSEANQVVTSEPSHPMVDKAINIMTDRDTGLPRCRGPWTQSDFAGGQMGSTNNWPTITGEFIRTAETFFAKSAIYYSRIFLSNKFIYSWVYSGDADDSWTLYDGTILRAKTYSVGTVNTTSGSATIALNTTTGGWVSPSSFMVGESYARSNAVRINISGGGTYNVSSITNNTSLVLTANVTANLTSANYTMYIGNVDFPQPKIETYGYYKLAGGFYSPYETNSSLYGNFVYYIPTDGKRVTANAAFCSQIYTPTDFTTCDGYLMIVGGSVNSSTTAGVPAQTSNFFRARWTTPGTVDDFTSAGSGYMDLTEIGALRFCSSINHNVVIGGTFGVGALQSTGDFDYPWSWLLISDSVAPQTPMVRMGDSVYFLAKNGFLYRCDGMHIEKVVPHFFFGRQIEGSNSTAATMPSNINADETMNRLLLSWEHDSTSVEWFYAKLVDLNHNTVTTIDAPLRTAEPHWFTCQGSEAYSVTDSNVPSGDYAIMTAYETNSVVYYIDDIGSGTAVPAWFVTKEINLGGNSDAERSVKQVRLKYQTIAGGAVIGIQIKESEASWSTYTSEDLWQNSATLGRYVYGTVGTSTHFTVAKADASKLYTYTGSPSFYVYNTSTNRWHIASSWVTTDPTNYTCTLTPTPGAAGKGSMHLVKTADVLTGSDIKDYETGEIIFGFNNLVDRPQVRVMMNHIVRFNPVRLTVVADEKEKRKLKP